MGLNDWLTEHLFVTYIMIFIMIAYIYNKVFRARRLPIFKSLIVYAIIAIGTFVLLVFQFDASLPIVQSLAVAIAMMVTYRLRMLYLNRSVRNNGASADKSDMQENNR